MAWVLYLAHKLLSVPVKESVKREPNYRERAENQPHLPPSLRGTEERVRQSLTRRGRTRPFVSFLHEQEATMPRQGFAQRSNARTGNETTSAKETKNSQKETQPSKESKKANTRTHATIQTVTTCSPSAVFRGRGGGPVWGCQYDEDEDEGGDEGGLGSENRMQSEGARTSAARRTTGSRRGWVHGSFAPHHGFHAPNSVPTTRRKENSARRKTALPTTPSKKQPPTRVTRQRVQRQKETPPSNNIRRNTPSMGKTLFSSHKVGEIVAVLCKG
ncbi:hypothetical protein C8F04DRAFT_1190586 [Mycena alexandri]|uniref:Uncharacterized protein n=1 Tax=Mycena alexandri TaxID=1745969 RepID=A0AAD6SFR6_9AGAR|nr:hypothetical protein C8F04DRAFT_1190586 [Mycena alexandri]